MNVVASSAWLEYFADGPNAEPFANDIEDTSALVVPVKTLLGVFKRISQQRDIRAVVWTQDADFKGLDGVRYLPGGSR